MVGTVWKSAKELVNLSIRWVDTRFSLQDAEAGRKLFDQGHIKDAVYLDLEKDLSDMTKTSGRHPLPDKETIQELFESHGFEWIKVVCLSLHVRTGCFAMLDFHMSHWFVKAMRN